MTLASEYKIPCVRIDVNNPKRTTRTLYTPMYELPLLEKRFAGTATVTARKIPGSSSLPEDMRFRVASYASEEKRLRAKYAKTRSGAPLFDSVYGFGMFQQAFERAASGAWSGVDGDAAESAPKADLPQPKVHPAMADFAEPPAEAPEHPVSGLEHLLADPEPANYSPLQAVTGVGPEIATALEERGVRTISALAEMSKDDLVALPGVGVRTAERILNSAVDLAFQGSEG